MKIAAYCRVSTDKTEQLDSLEHQKEFFYAYAAKNGHELVRIYADEGISGTSLKKRSEFQRLMREADSDLFELVVVKDISRFARNTVDFLQSIRNLKKKGINILFLTSNMESLGESEFVLTVFGALAQEESINLSKRVKFGKKINAKKGRVPQRIFGYDRIDNFTLQINPAEADVVRLIYRMYLDGSGCRTISSELNRMGYTTKYDCEWDSRSVSRILKNSIYCGRYVNNKYEVIDCLDGTRGLIPTEQHFHHDRPEWAVVTAEMFGKVQLQLEQRSRKYSKNSRYSGKHIFSTLIKCGDCGHSFSRKKYNNSGAHGAEITRVYWKCSVNDQYGSKEPNSSSHCGNNLTISETELTDAIRSYVISCVADKDSFIKGIIDEAERLSCSGNDTVSLVNLKKRRKLLLSKKDKYTEMYAEGIIAMAELKEKTSLIDEELKQLEYGIEQYGDSDNTEVGGKKTPDKYTAEIERAWNFENITNADMRRLVNYISADKEGNVTVYMSGAEEQA